MTYASAAEAYRRNAILTASPEKLVKILYEGAIQNLERTRIGLADQKTCRNEATGIALGKAMGIICELRSSINHEAGEQIARQLDSLYDFCIDKLTEANVSRKPQPVQHALTIMRTLKEGWDGIIPD